MITDNPLLEPVFAQLDTACEMSASSEKSRFSKRLIALKKEFFPILMTKFKDYQFTFELNTETTTVNNNGRVVEQPLYTEVVTYTITVNNGTTSETITLSTIVEGMYCK